MENFSPLESTNVWVPSGSSPSNSPESDLPSVVSIDQVTYCGAISLLGRKIESISRLRSSAVPTADSSGPIRPPRPSNVWHRPQPTTRK